MQTVFQTLSAFFPLQGRHIGLKFSISSNPPLLLGWMWSFVIRTYSPFSSTAYRFKCGGSLRSCVSRTKTVPLMPQVTHSVPFSTKSWMRMLLRNLFPSGNMILLLRVADIFSKMKSVLYVATWNISLLS